MESERERFRETEKVPIFASRWQIEGYTPEARIFPGTLNIYVIRVNIFLKPIKRDELFMCLFKSNNNELFLIFKHFGKV